MQSTVKRRPQKGQGACGFLARCVVIAAQSRSLPAVGRGSTAPAVRSVQGQVHVFSSSKERRLAGPG